MPKETSARTNRLVSGLGMGESPRWHDGRLWLSDWGTNEIVAVVSDGNREVMGPGGGGSGWAVNSFLGRTCSPPQLSSWTTRSSILKVPGQLGGTSSEERSLSWSLATRGPTGRPVDRAFTSSSATSAPNRGNGRTGGRASGSSRTQRTTTWTPNSSEKANLASSSDPLDPPSRLVVRRPEAGGPWAHREPAPARRAGDLSGKKNRTICGPWVFMERGDRADQPERRGTGPGSLDVRGLLHR